MKECFDDIKNELILQEKKGNLLNGAGVYLMVLVERAEQKLELSEDHSVAKERKSCIGNLQEYRYAIPNRYFPQRW